MSCPVPHAPDAVNPHQSVDTASTCPVAHPSSSSVGPGQESSRKSTEPDVIDESKLEKIPQPPEHLYGLLGNLPDVDPEFFAQTLWQFADLYGPIYRLNLVNRNNIVINNYDLAVEVMDENRFQKYTEGIVATVRNGLGNGLLSAYNDDERWAMAHRLLMPIFGPMGVRKMLPEMLDVAQQMILSWDRLGPDNEIVASEDFTKMAFDMIGFCGYGYRFNEFTNGLHPFAIKMADFLKESGRIANRTALETQLRVFSARKYQQNIQYMQDLVAEMMDSRRKRPEPDRHDLLNTMLFAADPVTGVRLDDQTIKDNMVTFLVAGHETSAATLSFLFYFLLKNPDTLMKAQREVDEVLGDDPFEAKHLSKFKYIEACIKETLRCKSPITQVIRTAKQTTVIGGKYKVTAQDAISLNLHKMHTDPAIWGDDAKEWKPDRMLHFERYPQQAWRPFGVSVRSCIGRSFAEQEVVVAVALALQRFQIDFADPSYDLVLKSTLTVKPENFKFKVRRRPGKGMLVGFAGRLASAEVQTRLERNHTLSQETVTAQTNPQEVLVFYGSNAGTCRAFADELQETAPAHGFTVKVQPLDAATENLSTTNPVVIITSTYEAFPPDNAKKFVSWLEANASNDSLHTGCRYAVFGVGNNEWAETFFRVPKLVDDLMVKEGAQRVCEAGYADVKENAIGSWENWQERFWTAISQKDSHAAPTEANKLVTKITHSKAAGVIAGEDISYGIVRSNVLLADDSVGPAKKVMDIELPAGTTYRAGDYLVVLPLNPLSQLQRVMKQFSLDNEDVIEMSGTKKSFLHAEPITTAYNLFASRVELSNTVTTRQLDTLAASATNPKDKEALLKLHEDSALYKSECIEKHLSILDVLEDYPSTRLSLAQYIDMLKPLAPRQYSISSSPLHDIEPLESVSQPIHASITYDIHVAPAWSGHDRSFAGVASTYLDSLTPGRHVRCFVRSTNAAFHLPADHKTPIIMMAAGTGIAPMRAFIQERAAVAKARGADSIGPMILYFGCRDYEKDFIHKSEMEEWESQDVVSVRPSFSKRAPPNAKEIATGYVPDRVFAERDELRDLFKQGAKIFVCGSASKLAKSNADALKRIWLEGNPGSTEKDAGVWLEGIREHRYVSDVFD